MIGPNARQQPKKVLEAKGMFQDGSILLREKIIEVVKNLPATKYVQKIQI